MEVVYRPVEELIEYKNNPRFNEKAVEPLAKSIEEFGFKVPILLDKDDVIIAGHTRLKAALLLGLTEVPCIICDDLTPEQVKALRLVDNKTSEFATWDLTLLEKELTDLLKTGHGFPVIDECFPDIDELNIDAYLDSIKEDEEPVEPRRIQCEHCGEWFEVE